MVLMMKAADCPSAKHLKMKLMTKFYTPVITLLQSPAVFLVSSQKSHQSSHGQSQFADQDYLKHNHAGSNLPHVQYPAQFQDVQVWMQSGQYPLSCL